MKKMSYLCLFSFLFWNFSYRITGAYQLSEGPVVQLSNGILLRGRQVITDAGNSGVSFQGIPYAEPPIGKLRFQYAVPFGTYSHSADIINCTDYGPACYQANQTAADTHQTVISEDCLTLNVFVPRLPATETNLNSTKYPVIAYIHGGGFEFDSPRMFPVDSLVDHFVADAQAPVVWVSIGYRLGPFGFWSTGSKEAPGNAAISDMLTALRWVQSEIALFSGDPDSVTIMGHSSGAFAVSLVTTIPQAKGLFHKVVQMSGGGTVDETNSDLEIFHKLVVDLSCDSENKANIVTCMQGIPANQISNAYVMLGTDISRPRVDTSFGILPTVQQSKQSSYPTFIGTMKYELSRMSETIMKSFNAQKIEQLCRQRSIYYLKGHYQALANKTRLFNTVVDLVNAACIGFYKEKFQADVEKEYSNTNGVDNKNDTEWRSWYVTAVAFLDDTEFFADTFMEAKRSQQTGATVYLYSFDYTKEDTNEPQGSKSLNPYHSVELTYLFDFNYNKPYFPSKTWPNDYLISSHFASLICNFAGFGNPTPEMQRISRNTHGPNSNRASQHNRDVTVMSERNNTNSSRNNNGIISINRKHNGLEQWKPLNSPIGFNYYSIDLPGKSTNKPFYNYKRVEFWSEIVPYLASSAMNTFTSQQELFNLAKPVEKTYKRKRSLQHYYGGNPKFAFLAPKTTPSVTPSIAAVTTTKSHSLDFDELGLPIIVIIGCVGGMLAFGAVYAIYHVCKDPPDPDAYERKPHPGHTGLSRQNSMMLSIRRSFKRLSKRRVNSRHASGETMISTVSTDQRYRRRDSVKSLKDVAQTTSAIVATALEDGAPVRKRSHSMDNRIRPGILLSPRATPQPTPRPTPQPTPKHSPSTTPKPSRTRTSRASSIGSRESQQKKKKMTWDPEQRDRTGRSRSTTIAGPSTSTEPQRLGFVATQLARILSTPINVAAPPSSGQQPRRLPRQVSQEVYSYTHYKVIKY